MEIGFDGDAERLRGGLAGGGFLSPAHTRRGGRAYRRAIREQGLAHHAGADDAERGAFADHGDGLSVFWFFRHEEGLDS